MIPIFKIKTESVREKVHLSFPTRRFFKSSANFRKSLSQIDSILGYPVISFHGQIVPSQIVPINSQIVPQNGQFVPQKSQFVPHMLYLFSKCVNVIRVQTSDRNMDESIFRTIYIMLRAPYVNFTMHCGTM